MNDRPFQKLPGSSASVFAELDTPALMPLPPQRYELARFKTVKVHIDYHVEIDGHRYSVPHVLVSQTLEARLSRHGVRGQRVAAHARSGRRGGFTTVKAHMPAAHRGAPGMDAAAPEQRGSRRHTLRDETGRAFHSWAHGVGARLSESR